MKFIYNILFFVSIIFSQIKTEPFLDIPKEIKGFSYSKDINTYMRSDVHPKIKRWVTKRVKKKKKIQSRSSLLSKKAQIVYLDEPNWIGYLGSNYKGLYFSVILRIDEKGKPQIIIFNKGGTEEQNRVFATYILKSQFKPALNKKMQKVKTWIRFNKKYITG